MFTLTHSRERIDRLMGSAAMPAGDDWKIAAHVIDGMLENDSNNGGGTFATWTSATDALTLYADHGFFERMEIEKCDFIVVRDAVAAALTKMQTREKLQGFSDEYIAEVFAGDVPGDTKIAFDMTDSAHDKFGIYDRTTVDLDLDTLTVSWTDSFGRDHERQFAPGSPSDLELGRREIERHPVEHVLGELAAHVESRDTDFISVGINGCDDFFLLEVPAGSDKDTIITAIEAENARIGGDIKDYDDAFAPANSVRVYRNGISIIEQEAQPNPFHDADVWNAEGKRIQSAA